MKQYKGAIFDLDGTLLDSMRVWDDIDVAFLKKRGLEVPPDYQEAITPLGFLEAARYTIRRFGFPETPEELIQEWHQMAVDAYTYEVELKDKMGGFAAVGVYDRSGEGNRAKMEQEADRYVTSFKELMNGGDSFF